MILRLGIGPTGTLVQVLGSLLKINRRAFYLEINWKLIFQAVRSDGHSNLSHEISLELSRRSSAAGLR